MSKSPKLARIATFQHELQTKDIDAAILVLSRDIFYYTGTAQPSILVVTPDSFFLIVRRALDFVERETWLPADKIISGGSFREAAESLKNLGITKGRLGLEMDVLPAELFLKIAKIFSSFEPVNIAQMVLSQRMVKDNDEVSYIRTASAIMNAGHKRILETLTSGMSELDLAAEVEYAHRKAGHEGILSMRNFDFHISRGPLSSGENLLKVSGFANTITGVGLSPAVPAGPSRRQINKGDLVIVDIPTCHHGYHCDETRTYVLGRADTNVTDLFSRLKEISDTTIDVLKSGVLCREVFAAAHSVARTLDVEELFLGLAPRKGNFVGHGIGLDANEAPILFHNSDFPLQDGFVITIELHLTHPSYGAVKLEDMVLIKENGCEILSVTERKLFEV